MAKVIPLVLAGSLLGVVVFMIGAVLWVRATGGALDDSGRAQADLSVQTEAGRLEAAIHLLPDLAYQLDIHVAREAGATGPIRPTVILEMRDMDMGRTEPPLHLVAPGEFHADGQFAMPGRWRVRLGFGRELYDLEVLVPSATEG